MKRKEMVEIWGDVVEVRSLFVSVIISIVSSMGMYLLAPKGDASQALFFGLFGAVLGFIITTILFKPKRNIIKEGLEDV